MITYLSDKIIAKNIADNASVEQIAHNIVNAPNSIIFPYSVKIIGTVTKDGDIDFDCDKYVKKTNEGTKYEMFFNYWLHKDTILENFEAIAMASGDSKYTSYKTTAKESFITLLNSKRLFLENLKNEKLLILEINHKP